MANTETDSANVSFTVLLDPVDLHKARAIAKDEQRTPASVIREALRQYLNNRKRRGKA